MVLLTVPSTLGLEFSYTFWLCMNAIFLCVSFPGAWSFAKLVIWLSSLSLVPVSCLVSITVPASCLLAYPWTSALSLSREGGNFITSRVERLKNHPCRTRLTQSFLFKCFLKLEIAPRCPTSYPTLSC